MDIHNQDQENKSFVLHDDKMKDVQIVASENLPPLIKKEDGIISGSSKRKKINGRNDGVITTVGSKKKKLNGTSATARLRPAKYWPSQYKAASNPKVVAARLPPATAAPPPVDERKTCPSCSDTFSSARLLAQHRRRCSEKSKMNDRSILSDLTVDLDLDDDELGPSSDDQDDKLNAW